MGRVGRRSEESLVEASLLLEAISKHGADIARAARVSLDSPVRACGSWRVADLLWHVGEVHRFWTSMARAGSSVKGEHHRDERPEEMDMISWYESGLSRLVATLSSMPLDQPCWTWAGPQNIEWLIRRMAHETTVHAWDAMWAAGLKPTIAPELASDGIDEFLYVMTPLVREGQPVMSGSVHVHCTDVEGEWLVVPGDAMNVTVTREHAKGSVALRGSAEDILLVLWRRLPLEALEVIGNESVAEKFLLRADLD